MKKGQTTTYILIALLSVIAIIVFIFILNSPKTTGNTIICNSPYIQVGQSCCLDSNHNNICDNDELTNTLSSNTTPNQQLSQSQNYCGDGICQSTESCSSCSTDCGICKKNLGDSCSYNSDCKSRFCVHDICRSSSIYCGDSFCDSGESYSTCPQDCQQPKPKNYELECTRSCGKGINFIVQNYNSNFNNIYFEIKNSNPKGCDISCDIWKSVNSDGSINSERITILNNGFANGELSLEDMKTASLICYELYNYSQIPMVCDNVDKQVFVPIAI